MDKNEWAQAATYNVIGDLVLANGLLLLLLRSWDSLLKSLAVLVIIAISLLGWEGFPGWGEVGG